MRNQMQVPGMPVQRTVQRTEISRNAEIRRLKRIFRIFGYIQCAIGVICFVLGTVLLVDVHDHYNFQISLAGFHSVSVYRMNLGEGVWCGIWIIAAGSLGIACGKKTVSQHLINSYMAFSILAAVFSGVMFALSIHVAESYTTTWTGVLYPLGFGVERTITGFGIVAVVLCIVSASFCCCWASKIVTNGVSYGCCECCQSERDIEPRNAYVVPNTGVYSNQPGIQPAVAVHYRPDIQARQLPNPHQHPAAVTADVQSRQLPNPHQHLAAVTADVQSRQLPNPHQHLAAEQHQKLDHTAAYQNTMHHNSGYNNTSMGTEPQSYRAD